MLIIVHVAESLLKMTALTANQFVQEIRTEETIHHEIIAILIVL